MSKLLSQIAAGLTVAALFRTAFEARDILETTTNQDTTLQNLRLRLDVEKCRLYLWGESMGLTDIDGNDENSDLRFPQVVHRVLEALVRLFRDAEGVKRKYVVDADVDSAGTRVGRTVTWLVYDRRRFSGLVDEIRLLVDRLVEVTGPVVLVDGVGGAERPGLGSVRDTEALALVAGVCAVDHPDVARLRRSKLRLGPGSYRGLQDSDGGGGNGIVNGNGNGNGFVRSTRYKYGNPRL